MTTKTGVAAIGVLIAVSPLFVSAQTTTIETKLLETLLAQVQLLQAQLLGLLSQQNAATSTTVITAAAPLPVQAAGSADCALLTKTFGPGDSDATIGGDVARLQQFLVSQHAGLDAHSVTGFFGPKTFTSLKQWQADHGIASSGTPETTGWGFVGPKTRNAISSTCTVPPIVVSTTTVATAVPTSASSSTATSTKIVLPTAPAAPVVPSAPTVSVSGGGGGGGGSVSAPAPVVVATPSAQITTTPLTFSSARPTISGTASNITSLVINFVTPSGGLESFSYGGAQTAVSGGVWSYTADRDLTNGTWELIVADPVHAVPLTSGEVTISGLTVFAQYTAYINGSIAVQTENSSQADALANCTLNATNNPSAAIRCVWNGTDIYTRAGTSSPSSDTATSSSATSTPAAPPVVVTPTVDLKVNGSDGPLALYDMDPITVSWTSQGVASCGIYGVWETTNAQYANIQNLPTSGTRSLYAYVPGYAGFVMRLRCQTSATPPAPYDDTVSITQSTAMSADPYAQLAGAYAALESALSFLKSLR